MANKYDGVLRVKLSVQKKKEMKYLVVRNAEKTRNKHGRNRNESLVSVQKKKKNNKALLLIPRY